MTREEAKSIRNSLDSLIGMIKDSPAEINANLSAILPWEPGAHAKDNVRMHKGIPYKCEQAHDSTGNPAWNPADASALWTQYHGTSRETARAWVQPQGAHDMYRAGEWMIWTDGLAYPCISDTTFTPVEWPGAWGAPEKI